jgi:hypothetical protein
MGTAYGILFENREVEMRCVRHTGRQDEDTEVNLRSTMRGTASILIIRGASMNI